MPRFLERINSGRVSKSSGVVTLPMPDWSLAEELLADGTTDSTGHIRFCFNAATAWRKVGKRTRPDGRHPDDVAGYLFFSADMPWMQLSGDESRAALVANSPTASLTALVPVDSSKLIIGHTTATSTRLWFQLHGQPKRSGRFYCEITHGNAVVQRSLLTFSDDLACTVVIEVSDLRPSTPYSVALVAEASAPRRRRTLARGEVTTPAADPSRWSIAFGSCHLPSHLEHLGPWKRAAARTSDDLLLLLGDQIYGDGAEKHAPLANTWFERYVRRYNQLWTYQPMRDVLRRTPTCMMFDDHEVIDDWGVASDDEIGSDRLQAALLAYRRFQDPLAPGNRAAGVYDYGLHRGALACYMLDQRSHRGRDDSSNVLGSAQLERFRAWANSAKTRNAEIILLGSPLPLAYLPIGKLMDLAERTVVTSGVALGALVGAGIGGPAGAAIGGFLGAFGAEVLYDEVTGDLRQYDVKDQWVYGKNQAELTKVLDILFDLANDIRGGVPRGKPRAVIVLSGDIHVGAVHLLHSNRRNAGHDHGRNRLIYQFVGSPVSQDVAQNVLLDELLEQVSRPIDLDGAQFLEDDPDRSNEGPLAIDRFLLDSAGGGHYAAEFLGVLREQNFGRLVIERVSERRYQLQSTVEGRRDSLVTLFELDLDAPQVKPKDLIGQRLATVGTPILLRVHELQSGYGPPSDRIECESVVILDTEPGRAFGLPLRIDGSQEVSKGMLALLREAFNANTPVRVEYDRTGPLNGLIVRVTNTVS